MEITNYAQAADFLARGRNKTSRPLPGNGTRLERRGSAIAVCYRGTDVVTFFRDGTIALERNNYLTDTTWRRIETYSPFRILAGYCRTTWSYSRDCVRRGPHQWQLRHPNGSTFGIQDGFPIAV